MKLKEINPPARIHIMGICGVAMSALAGLLKQKGYRVTGSDRQFYPPISDQLKQMNIPTFVGYKAENIKPNLDLVIVGNVISKNMPEAKALLQSGLPYITLPQALNTFFIKQKNTVMVCGTHGKTTVSCLSAWVLNQCGLDPGFIIGGIAENFKTNYRLTNSSWFVVEGDEYDTAFFEKTPKCIHYHATHVLLNNIEFDHADIYKDIKAVEQAFSLLIHKKTKVCFIAGVESPLVEKLISQTKQKVVTYGITKGDWRLTHRTPLEGGGQTLHITSPDQKIIDISIPLSGEYNALNVLSIWVLADVLKLNKNTVSKALKSFKGVRRRFQVLGDFLGRTLIEDFAHHPTAVAAVLQSTREIYPHRRIVALFEPRSNTSQKNIFQKDYEKSLSLADLIFCMKAYESTTMAKDCRFSSTKLVNNLNKNKKRAFDCESIQNMLSLLKKKSLKGDVILIMSNGHFGGIYTLLKQLFTP